MHIRPRITPSASTTCHSRWISLTFGVYVFIGTFFRPSVQPEAPELRIEPGNPTARGDEPQRAKRHDDPDSGGRGQTIGGRGRWGSPLSSGGERRHAERPRHEDRLVVAVGGEWPISFTSAVAARNSIAVSPTSATQPWRYRTNDRGPRAAAVRSSDLSRRPPPPSLPRAGIMGSAFTQRYAPTAGPVHWRPSLSAIAAIQYC